MGAVGQLLEQCSVAALGASQVPAGIRRGGQQPRQRRPFYESHVPPASPQLQKRHRGRILRIMHIVQDPERVTEHAVTV